MGGARRADLVSRTVAKTGRKGCSSICRKIPRGEFSVPQAMKRQFALEAGADLTCPVTTRMHLKTVAEAALSQLAAGSSLSAITPFWRLLGPDDPVGKGLSCGPEFLRERRAEEGNDARADRLFPDVQHLRGGRLVTARMLSERLEVSERTIYRDVADLQSTGVPVDGEAGVGYILREGFDLPPLMFTRDEIVALVAGARMARAFGGAAMARSAEEALIKIGAVCRLRCRHG